MFRFYNLFIPGTCGLVGAVVTSYFAGNFVIERIFAGVLIPVLLWGTGQVVNDYCDQSADRINRNRTSIVKGDINSKKAIYISFIVTAFLIIVSFRLDFSAGIISIIAVLSYLAYCIKLKGMPLIGNTWFGFTTSLCVLLGSAISGGAQNLAGHPIIWIIFISNAIFQGGHVLIGYFKDIDGDEKAGYRTLCVVLRKKLRYVALITLIYSILPISIGIIAWLYHSGHCFPNANYLVFQIISLIISLKAQIILINNPLPSTGYISFSMHKYSIIIYFLSWLASFIPVLYASILIAGSILVIRFSINKTKIAMQL